jgi:hypothetical protein
VKVVGRLQHRIGKYKIEKYTRFGKSKNSAVLTHTHTFLVVAVGGMEARGIEQNSLRQKVD